MIARSQENPKEPPKKQQITLFRLLKITPVRDPENPKDQTKRIALKLAIKNYIRVLQGTSLYVNDGFLDTLSRLSQYLSRISAQFSGALGCTSVLGKHLRCEKNKDYLLVTRLGLWRSMYHS